MRTKRLTVLLALLLCIVCCFSPVAFAAAGSEGITGTAHTLNSSSPSVEHTAEPGSEESSLPPHARSGSALGTVFVIALVIGGVAAGLYFYKKGNASRRKEQSRYWLIGQSGAYTGKRFAIKGELRLGRDPNRCDLLFPQTEAELSGLHCQLSVKEGELCLEDCQSTNGTYLNGWRIEPQVPISLKNGDIIALANSGESFRVEVFYS